MKFFNEKTRNVSFLAWIDFSNRLNTYEFFQIFF